MCFSFNVQGTASKPVLSDQKRDAAAATAQSKGSRKRRPVMLVYYIGGVI